MEKDDIWSNRANKGLAAWIDPKWKLIKNMYIDYIHKIYLEKFLFKELSNLKNILDFWCWNWRFSFYFTNTFNKVTGIDLSKEMIINAQKYKVKNNIDNIKFINDDILKKDFLNEKFHNIFTSWCLQHILNEEILENIIKNFSNIIESNWYVIIIEQTKKEYEKEYYRWEHYKDLRTTHYYKELFESKWFILVKQQYLPERTLWFFGRWINLLPNFMIKFIPLFFIIDKLLVKIVPSKTKTLDTLMIFKKIWI